MRITLTMAAALASMFCLDALAEHPMRTVIRRAARFPDRRCRLRPAPHRRPGPSRSGVSAAVAAPNATLPSSSRPATPHTVVLTGGNASGTFDQPKTTISGRKNPVAIAAENSVICRRRPRRHGGRQYRCQRCQSRQLMVLPSQPDGSYAPLDFGGQIRAGREASDRRGCGSFWSPRLRRGGESHRSGQSERADAVGFRPG